MAVDPHRIGEFRIGYSRIGVVDPVFEGWEAQGLTVEVTRRRRIVDSTSDLYTQHPNLEWETGTIDAQISFGQTGREDLSMGVMGSVEGIIKTADPLFHLDRFDYEGSRYEISSPPIEVRGREGSFLYRKTVFKRVELEEP